MKKYLPAIRRWHMWLGVFLLIPIIIVSITAILLAHEGSLGLGQIKFYPQWLPGFTHRKPHPTEVKAIRIMPDGRMYIGNRSGLYMMSQGKLKIVQALKGKNIREIVLHGQTLYVVTRKGVWIMDGSSWRRIYHGDAHGVSIDTKGTIYIAAHKNGLMASTDNGQHWTEVKEVRTTLALLPHPTHRRSLEGFIRDMHKGKAIVGRTWAWVWIDLLSILISSLAFFGTIMWWQRRRH
ncbi:MAG: hypothetical protein Q9M24_04230 [Mariprofundaceae bacterium]|nr:hypothetical protein [Mariprofundaceae bacterium]